jgi:hypothetical protein
MDWTVAIAVGVGLYMLTMLVISIAAISSGRQLRHQDEWVMQVQAALVAICSAYTIWRSL